MARTMRGRRGFAAAQRRKLTWATAAGTFSGINTDGVMEDLLANYKAAGGSTQGCTVIRTHIDIAIQTATPNIADGVFCGLIVANDPNTLSDYGPTEGFLDWALYRHLFVMGTTSGSSSQETRYEIDLRAKRRIQELQESWYLNLTALLGVNSTNVTYNARTLLALP